MSEDLLAQARMHVDRKNLKEAEKLLLQHLNEDFNSAEALFMLGAIYMSENHSGLCAALTKQALAIRPTFPEALLNLGSTYKAVHKHDLAEQFWNLALEIEDIPAERAKILANMASLWINEGCPGKSLPLLQRALEANPKEPSAIFNKSFAHLEMGEWREGWKLYDAGFETGGRTIRHYGGLPWWDGSEGKKIIVYGDQGVGDEIMFASMLPDVIKDCREVILDCHPRLVNLFARSFPTVDIKGTRKTINLDWHKDCGAEASIASSSLGHLYRNEDGDFPGKPFLKADKPTVKKSGKMRVGIAWHGGTFKTRSDLRSIPLPLWTPILRSIDADWFSLQYGDQAAADVCALEEETGVHLRHSPAILRAADYDKTASLVAGLDLVITVCTAIHHLSNAIGVPTWTLIPSKPAWRYADKGELWYKTTSTFFRQKHGESWDAVISRVGESLADYAGISKPERAVA